MFYDKAKIHLKSGHGGDGMISFRREAHVPRGGPDGGDGGDGGDIVFVTNANINSLVRYHRQNHFKAGDGVDGLPKNRTGARGDTLRLEVPVGTTIWDAETNGLLADLAEEGQEVLLLKGGRGGRGNAHFASSANQAPRIAERGEPSEDLWVRLELKLIADVGIVGVPNAGKSTLLSVVSGAKPKIAGYPFTTLQPSLGVVTLDSYETMVLADIPGLIEGASEGVGLGYEFLRHVERTRVLIHLLDGAAKEPLEDWATINQELALYDVELEKKPQLVVLNKLDLKDAEAWEPILREEIETKGYPFHAISAVTGEGVQEMLYKVKQMLNEAPEPEKTDKELVVIRPEPDEATFTVERLSQGWRVKGKKIERVAAMTYFEFEPTLNRFQRILDEMGVTQALRESGVEEGDTVVIGDAVLEWTEWQE